MKKLVTLLFFLVYAPVLIAQVWNDPWDEEYTTVLVKTDTLIVHDTIYISTLEDVTRFFNMSFDEFSRQLLNATLQEDTITPRTLERIYLNYLMPMYFPATLQHRYIYRNYTVEMQNEHLTLESHMLPEIHTELADSLEMDVLLTCRGEMHTDYFLQSPTLRASCLEQLFMSIHHSSPKKIKGLNLYFPDYSFREKRAMAQFIKSASIVIDSCKMNSIRDLRLYITFDKEIGRHHTDYLCTLTQMADSVLLVDSKKAHWPLGEIEVIDKTDAMKTGWWTKVLDQIYLARFYIKPFPQTDPEKLTEDDLRQLIFADYPDNPWEVYLFILLAIAVLACLFLLLYRFVPVVSHVIHDHLPFVFGFLFMFIFEIYILFICMVEAMSNEHVFTLEGDNIHNILYLPLFFLFIIPMLNFINKRKEKP